MTRLSIYAIVLLGLNPFCHAQSRNSADPMIAAERAFAAMSRTIDTRTAFLAYLSDSTILFHNGTPVRGRKRWEERQIDSTLLFWEPVFAGVSADGKMGFSTGPWEWSKNRSSRPEAFGFFASVWEESSGGWKLAADIGISFKERYVIRDLVISPSANEHVESTDLTLSDADIAYGLKLQSGQENFGPLLTDDAMILREGRQPSAIRQFEQEEFRQYKFNQVGCKKAQSGDLGFCYGTAMLKTGDSPTQQKSYLRVFKISYPNEWKVVLDVIGGR